VQKERRRTNPGDRRRIRRRIAAAPHARAASVAGLDGATEERRTPTVARANIRGRGRGGGGPRRRRGQSFVGGVLPESEEERRNRLQVQQTQTAASVAAPAADDDADDNDGEQMMTLGDVELLADLALESTNRE
jgi:hypothetical protein